MTGFSITVNGRNRKVRTNPRPSDSEIDRVMSNPAYRCGAYVRVRRAIQRAAAEGGWA